MAAGELLGLLGAACARGRSRTPPPSGWRCPSGTAAELLAKAQKQVMKNTPFKWGRWVEQECGIKERTASNYIRLYRNRSKIEKVADTSTLQVKAALSMLKKRSRAKKGQAHQLTLTDLGGLMVKHGIHGQPQELVAMLEEIGLKVPVAPVEQTATATCEPTGTYPGWKRYPCGGCHGDPGRPTAHAHRPPLRGRGGRAPRGTGAGP